MGNQHSFIYEDSVELNGSLMTDSFNKIPMENTTVCFGKHGIRVIFDSYHEKNISYDRIIEVTSENLTPDSVLTIEYIHGHLSTATRILKFLVESANLPKMRDVLRQHGLTIQ